MPKIDKTGRSLKSGSFVLVSSCCILQILTILATSVTARPLFTFSSIGDASDSGSQWVSDSMVELRGAAKGLQGNADEALFVFGSVTGNFDYQARCVQIIDSSTRSEAGLMVRSDTAPGAPFCELAILHERGTVFRYRTSFGSEIKTINISPNIYSCLRIKRTGSQFKLYYKYQPDHEWVSFPTLYKFSFPAALCAGLVHASNEEGFVSSSRWENVTGLPEETILAPSCDPLLYDFEDGKSPDSLGFRNVDNWAYDTSGFIKTVLDADTVNSASILTPPFTTELGRDTVRVSWDLFFESDTLPRLSDYSMYSTEQMILGDRTRITGQLIGCAAGIQIGIDDTIISNIQSTGSVLLRDRAKVTGDVSAGDTCTLLSGASVSGLILENSTVRTPLIPVRTFDTGTVSITISPNDSLNLTPGNYSTFHAFGNSRVRFNPGTYTFSTFMTEPDVKIYLNSDVSQRIDLNILNNFQLADRTTMLLPDTSAQSNITFYTHQQTTVTFGANLVLFGSFLLPNAEAHVISRSCVIRGGLYARKITCEPDVKIAVHSAPFKVDRFEATFTSADGGETDQTFTFLVHRNRDLDTIADFKMKSGSTETASASSGSPTPFGRYLNFEVVLSPSDSGIISTLLYHNGTGAQKIFDSIPFSISSLSSVAFEIHKENLDYEIQARLDNISISCTSDPCPPMILLSSPSDTTVYENSTVSFTCSVEAENSIPVYQWYRNGVAVPWTNSPIFQLQNVQTSDDGSSVFCIITGACDAITTGSAVLRVLDCISPLISDQPDNDTAMVGQTVTFSVTAQGTGLQYQWKRNGDTISGATSHVYTISNVKANNNLDQYRVLVKNGCGKVTLSNPATLVISDLDPCRITQHPRSDTLMEEENYYTGVEAICPNVTYTWYRNGILLTGVSSKNLVYGPVTLSDKGSEFFCIVSNGVTQDTSDIAHLTVASPRDTRSAIAISGELFDGVGLRQGAGTSVYYDFKVQLYLLKIGGTPLYTEKFKGIKVREGSFTVTLGRGKSDGDLQKIVSSHKELYAEVYAGLDGKFELAAPRLQLTAAPYAFTSGIKEIYGNGNPGSAEAPIGTMYIDQADNNSTWKLGKVGWVKLD